MSAPAFQPLWMCRKELAARIGISTRQLAKVETQLGLDVARVQLNSRVLYYHRAQAMEILSKPPTPTRATCRRVRSGHNLHELATS